MAGKRRSTSPEEHPQKILFNGARTALYMTWARQTRPSSREPSGLARLQQKTGVKIDRIETFTGGTNIGFVRIRADDGSEGIGQIAPFDKGAQRKPRRDSGARWPPPRRRTWGQGLGG